MHSCGRKRLRRRKRSSVQNARSTLENRIRTIRTVTATATLAVTLRTVTAVITKSQQSHQRKSVNRTKKTLKSQRTKVPKKLRMCWRNWTLVGRVSRRRRPSNWRNSWKLPANYIYISIIKNKKINNEHSNVTGEDVENNIDKTRPRLFFYSYWHCLLRCPMFWVNFQFIHKFYTVM